MCVEGAMKTMHSRLRIDGVGSLGSLQYILPLFLLVIVTTPPPSYFKLLSYVATPDCTDTTKF